MEDDIIYLKLVSGEHIVSALDTSDEDHIYLIKPLQLFVYNSYQGASVKIAKWIPFVEEQNFPVAVKHVMTWAKPDADVKDFYIHALESLEKIRTRTYNQPLNENFEESDDEKEVTEAFFQKYSNTNITVH